VKSREAAKKREVSEIGPKRGKNIRSHPREREGACGSGGRKKSFKIEIRSERERGSESARLG